MTSRPGDWGIFGTSLLPGKKVMGGPGVMRGNAESARWSKPIYWWFMVHGECFGQVGQQDKEDLHFLPWRSTLTNLSTAPHDWTSRKLDKRQTCGAHGSPAYSASRSPLLQVVVKLLLPCAHAARCFCAMLMAVEETIERAHRAAMVAVEGECCMG